MLSGLFRFLILDKEMCWNAELIAQCAGDLTCIANVKNKPMLEKIGELIKMPVMEE